MFIHFMSAVCPVLLAWLSPAKYVRYRTLLFLGMCLGSLYMSFQFSGFVHLELSGFPMYLLFLVNMSKYQLPMVWSLAWFAVGVALRACSTTVVPKSETVQEHLCHLLLELAHAVVLHALDQRALRSASNPPSQDHTRPTRTGDHGESQSGKTGLKPVPLHGNSTVGLAVVGALWGWRKQSTLSRSNLERQYQLWRVEQPCLLHVLCLCLVGLREVIMIVRLLVAIHDSGMPFKALPSFWLNVAAQSTQLLSPAVLLLGSKSVWHKRGQIIMATDCVFVVLICLWYLCPTTFPESVRMALQVVFAATDLIPKMQMIMVWFLALQVGMLQLPPPWLLLNTAAWVGILGWLFQAADPVWYWRGTTGTPCVSGFAFSLLCALTGVGMAVWCNAQRRLHFLRNCQWQASSSEQAAASKCPKGRESNMKYASALMCDALKAAAWPAASNQQQTLMLADTPPASPSSIKAVTQNRMLPPASPGKAPVTLAATQSPAARPALSLRGNMPSQLQGFSQSYRTGVTSQQADDVEDLQQRPQSSHLGLVQHKSFPTASQAAAGGLGTHRAEGDLSASGRLPVCVTKTPACGNRSKPSALYTHKARFTTISMKLNDAVPLGQLQQAAAAATSQAVATLPGLQQHYIVSQVCFRGCWRVVLHVRSFSQSAPAPAREGSFTPSGSLQVLGPVQKADQYQRAAAEQVLNEVLGERLAGQNGILHPAVIIGDGITPWCMPVALPLVMHPQRQVDTALHQHSATSVTRDTGSEKVCHTTSFVLALPATVADDCAADGSTLCVVVSLSDSETPVHEQRWTAAQLREMPVDAAGTLHVLVSGMQSKRFCLGSEHLPLLVVSVLRQQQQPSAAAAHARDTLLGCCAVPVLPADQCAELCGLFSSMVQECDGDHRTAYTAAFQPLVWDLACALSPPAVAAAVAAAGLHMYADTAWGLLQFLTSHSMERCAAAATSSLLNAADLAAVLCAGQADDPGSRCQEPGGCAGTSEIDTAGNSAASITAGGSVAMGGLAGSTASAPVQHTQLNKPALTSPADLPAGPQNQLCDMHPASAAAWLLHTANMPLPPSKQRLACCSPVTSSTQQTQQQQQQTQQQQQAAPGSTSSLEQAGCSSSGSSAKQAGCSSSGSSAKQAGCSSSGSSCVAAGWPGEQAGCHGKASALHHAAPTQASQHGGMTAARAAQAAVSSQRGIAGAGAQAGAAALQADWAGAAWAAVVGWRDRGLWRGVEQQYQAWRLQQCHTPALLFACLDALGSSLICFRMLAACFIHRSIPAAVQPAFLVLGCGHVLFITRSVLQLLGVRWLWQWRGLTSTLLEVAALGVLGLLNLCPLPCHHNWQWLLHTAFAANSLGKIQMIVVWYTLLRVAMQQLQPPWLLPAALLCAVQVSWHMGAADPVWFWRHGEAGSFLQSGCMMVLLSLTAGVGVVVGSEARNRLRYLRARQAASKNL